MANISVTVQDGNNITLVSTPTPTQVITIDRGIAGPQGPAGDPGDPAGSQYQIQYNSGLNTFTASPNLTFNGSNLIVLSSSSSDAVRITQTGIGNALLVEDSTNPDATPFAIDATGTVLAGFTTAPAGGYKAYVSGSAFATSAWRVGNNVDGSTSGYIGNISNTTKSLAIHADPDNLGASSVITINIDGSEKARLDNAGRFYLGSASASAAGIKNYWNLTGATTAYGELIGGAIQSDVTASANLVSTIANTAAATFNIANLRHFVANSTTFGVGSTVTSQFGFAVSSTLTEATNNYGSHSAIPAATGDWNFYAAGTADNYFAGNVGLGVTTPEYKLDITATDNVTTTIAMVVQNSSRNYGIGIGAYTMSNRNIGGVATNIDYTFDIGGAAIFKTADTERMRLDSAGNLGLGVTPSAWATYKALQVGGVGFFVGGSAGLIGSNMYYDGSAFRYINSSNYAGYYNTNNSGGHAWYTAPIGTAGAAITFTQAMTLTSGGNLGIGTATPATMLELSANNTTITTDPLNILRFTDRDTSSAASQPCGRIEWYSGDTDSAGVKAYIQGQAQDATPDGNLVFATHSVAGGGIAERMRLDFAGNLGIGTTTPVTTLHAQSAGATLGGLTNIVSTVYDTAATTTGIKAVLGFGTTNGTSSPLHGAIGAVRETVTASDGQGGLSFYTRPSGGASLAERMRIDSAGNVGVGTATPLTVGAKTTVDIEGVAGGALRLSDTTASLFLDYADGIGGQLSVNAAEPMMFLTNSSEQMRIDSAGNVGIGTSAPTAYLEIAGNGLINDKLLYVNGAGVSLGQSGPFYGVYVDAVSNNNASSGYGGYFDSYGGGGNFYGVWGQAAQGQSTVDSIGVLGKAIVNAGSTNHSPNRAIGTGPVAGVYALSETTGVGTASQTTALYAKNASAAGATAYGVFIDTIVGATTVIPFVVNHASSELMRIDSLGNVQVQDGAVVVYAPAPAAISTTATLTNANIQAQIINTTGTTYTVTMALGTTLETLVPWSAVNLGYNFTVINTASGTITMAVNTGVTALGALTIATGVSANFRLRRTAANTFIMYRIS